MFLFSDLPGAEKRFLYCQIESAYPVEGCGLVLKELDRPQDHFFVLPVRNVSDEYEGSDTTKTFLMDWKYLHDVVFPYLNSDRYSIVAMYHSHTNHEPLEMSDFDKAVQFHNDESTVIFPEMSHVIFKVVSGKIEQIHTYIYDEVEKDFVLKQELNFFTSKPVL